MTLDTDLDLCQSDSITAPVPFDQEPAPCEAMRGATTKTSSKSGHGGPRANSGGARPNCGGPQPGSGRPRKTKPIGLAPAYAADELHWCVLAFWGQAAPSATTELTRDGHETYLPMVAIRRRDPVIASMWHTVRVPYLPGYGFIRLSATQTREPILATRGVREVLRLPNGRPAWVPDGEIERMKAWDERRLVLPKEHGPMLKVGTMVRVDDGPFTSFPGRVLECDGVKTQVSVEIFGRSTPVWLDRVSVSEIA